MRKKQTPHLSIVNELEMKLWAYDYDIRAEAGLLTQEEDEIKEKSLMIEGEVVDANTEEQHDLH